MNVGVCGWVYVCVNVRGWVGVRVCECACACGCVYVWACVGVYVLDAQDPTQVESPHGHHLMHANLLTRVLPHAPLGFPMLSIVQDLRRDDDGRPLLTAPPVSNLLVDVPLVRACGLLCAGVCPCALASACRRRGSNPPPPSTTRLTPTVSAGMSTD
jgi:hypothetical protein